MKKKNRGLIAIIIAAVLLVSAILVCGTDTSWGDVEVSHIVLASDTGDEVNCLLYKPKTATAENPAPCVLLGHGGNDMMEQMTSYCIELSRRGYVCITRDATGNHNSDPATAGTAEKERSGGAGSPSGFDVVFKTVQNFNFVDKDHIVVMGHSLGGTNQLAMAMKYQDQIFMSMHLGQNVLGDATNQVHDFNFAFVLGDADESVMFNSTPQNNTFLSFQTEQSRRLFYNDYETPEEQLPQIEMAKTYTVTGSNGKEYHRTAYRPESCHAYYLVTNDAVQTVVYAITSEVGFGRDAGVETYADHGKIDTVWQWHDIGYFFIFASVVAIIMFTGAALLRTKTFESLILDVPETKLSYNKKSWQWIVTAIIFFIAPLLLFKYGVSGSTKFLGFIDVSNLWLCGGNNRVIVVWQWYMSLVMLACFLFYHFTYGKKNGGNLRTYGFASSNDGKFSLGYVGKAFAFGLLSVGAGYLAFALVSAYTKEGIHIATFMLSTISTKRTFAAFMFFLFQIPYFVISSMAFKSLGFAEGDKSTVKSVALTVLFSVGSLFIYWLFFLLYLTGKNQMPYYIYDQSSLIWKLICPQRAHVYVMLKMPLTLCMAVATTLNLTVSKKTKSIWTGLFTALLFGTWMLVSCGEITKIFY